MVRGEINTWFQPQEVQVVYVTALEEHDFSRIPAYGPGGLLHPAELPGVTPAIHCACTGLFSILQLFIVPFCYFNVILKACFTASVFLPADKPICLLASSLGLQLSRTASITSFPFSTICQS